MVRLEPPARGDRSEPSSKTLLTSAIPFQPSELIEAPLWQDLTGTTELLAPVEASYLLEGNE
jgi:hypothetical protein